MSDYNLKGDKMSMGSNAWIYIDTKDDTGATMQKVGHVESWSISKQLQTQEARVIGTILPASVDVTGISVSINLSGFIPTKETAAEKEGTIGGGQFSIKALNPKSDNLLTKKVATKIPFLAIVDDKHGSILTSVKWLTPESYRESGNGAGYIKADCSFKAVESDNSTDFESLI